MREDDRFPQGCNASGNRSFQRNDQTLRSSGFRRQRLGRDDPQGRPLIIQREDVNERVGKGLGGGAGDEPEELSGIALGQQFSVDLFLDLGLGNAGLRRSRAFERTMRLSP